jgi:putative Holliday junction resolvase
VGRVLGVDLGSRRIGLAISDPEASVATPRGVIARSGDPAADHRTITSIAREAGADRIVVGLPLSLSGEAGPAARAVLE